MDATRDDRKGKWWERERQMPYDITYMWNQVVPVVKSLPANTGDTRDLGLIPGSGRSPQVGNGNPLQYSCLLENPMDRGAQQATVHGAAESDTTEHVHMRKIPLGSLTFTYVEPKVQHK